MEIRKVTQAVRGRYRSNYSQDDLEKAYHHVLENNVPIQRAATQFGVPITTLKDRIRGRVALDTLKSGPLPMFTQEEEAILARHVTLMGEIGYGYTRRETLNLATDYAVHLGYRDRDHPLSLYWLYSFIERNPELKVQKPRKLESSRARSASKEAVSNYFREITKIMDRHNFQDSPQSIFNIDEKGLSTDVVPGKIVAGTHCKPQAVTTGKSQTVTMIGAVSATGNTVPPYFVFPGQRMRDDLMQGALPGVQGTVTESGWSNTEVFTNYMKTHFVNYVPQRSADSPVLVLYDGHKSHVSLGLIQWAQKNHIILFVLPPHTSHLLQPLDVGCYGPFECAWIAACHAHLRQTGGKVITRYDVCNLACKVHSSTMTVANIISSFKKSGIFPLNINIVPDTAVAPALAFPKPSINVSCVEGGNASSAVDFLEGRGGKLLENVKIAKTRNTLSKVVAGKAITDEAVVSDIRQHQAKQGKKRKATPTVEQRVSPVNCPTTCTANTSGRSSRVDITKGKGSSSGKNMNKGKRKQKRAIEEPELAPDSDDASDEDDAKCCACGKSSPPALRDNIGITFVKWAECSSCGHWVHLRFCTDVTVVRRHGNFHCMHCTGIPEE